MAAEKGGRRRGSTTTRPPDDGGIDDGGRANADTAISIVWDRRDKMVRVAMMMEGRGGLGGNVSNDDWHCQQHECAENESWLCDRTRRRRVLHS